jgi:putative transposase
MDSQSLSHTKWNFIYHIVFIPKYRRKIMYGELRNDIRAIIRQLCEYKSVAIVQGGVSKDHVQQSKMWGVSMFRYPRSYVGGNFRNGNGIGI